MAAVPNDKPESLSSESQIVFATRAPLASDKGSVWVHDKGGSSNDVYFRNIKTSGTWVKH